MDHHAAVIAKVCLRLPEHSRDELLKTLAAHGSEMSHLPWKNAKELANDLDSMHVYITCRAWQHLPAVHAHMCSPCHAGISDMHHGMLR